MINGENMTKPDKEGGYPVPDRIAIWLYRWQFLQLLAERAGLRKAYYFDSKGMRYYKVKNDNK